MASVPGTVFAISHASQFGSSTSSGSSCSSLTSEDGSPQVLSPCGSGVGTTDEPFQAQQLDVPEALQQLQTCRALESFTGRTAEVLACAGSRLQRDALAAGAMTSVAADDAFDTALEAERDRSVAMAGHGLVSACGDLGTLLVGLAAQLTSELLTPLKEFAGSLQAEMDKQRAQVAELERQESEWSGALAESQQKKEHISLELQERARQRDKAKEKQRSLSFRVRRVGAEGRIEHADHRLQTAALAQAVAVEQFAKCTDQVALTRIHRSEAVKAFHSVLADAQTRRRCILRQALGRCVAAWEETAAELRASAMQLQATTASLAAMDRQQAGCCPAVPKLCLNALASLACNSKNEAEKHHTGHSGGIDSLVDSPNKQPTTFGSEVTLQS